MPAPSTFDYAILRVVPRVERGECMNVGVILWCKVRDYLAARVGLDRARLLALDPYADVEAIEQALALVPLIAAGDPAGGPVARLPALERFHWLVAPRSTLVQPSPVHSGLCDPPDAALERLFATTVLPPAPPR